MMLWHDKAHLAGGTLYESAMSLQGFPNNYTLQHPVDTAKCVDSNSIL